MAPALSKYFSVSVENHLEFICLIASCGKRVLVSKSNKTGNLKRHMERIHPDIDIVPKEINEKMCYEMKKRILLQACVEMVTVNGRPLLALDDSGFRKIIDPHLQELEAAGHKLEISSKSIKEHITAMAEKVRQKIKSEMKDRVISVMADVATKHHRGILGINARYCKDGKVVLRTLGMEEMEERHTGETIANMIKNNLSSYDISVSHVHSFTSDNAKSMLKSGRLLNEEATEIQNAIDDERDSDIEILSDSDVEIVSDTAHELENLAESVASILKRENASLQLITGIGCAAHSLQTAIQDALKANQSKLLIRKCRNVVKTLRTQNVLLELKKFNVSIPTLDVKTRWNSKFLMVCRCTAIIQKRNISTYICASADVFYVP